MPSVILHPTAPRTSSPSSPHPPLPPWRRILYERQPYPDNYTPPTFLAQYLNPSPSSPSSSLPYLSLVHLTLPITSRLSLLTLFVSLFFLIDRGLSPVTLLLINLGFIVTLILLSCFTPSPTPSSPSSLLLLSLLLFLFSPLLSSLTSSYSSDTIYTLTLLLSLFHLLTLPSPTLSLNSALFLSILLASRLSSPSLTFLLLLSSALLFASFPLLHSQLPPRLQLVLTSLLVLSSSLSLSSLSPLLLLLSLPLHLTVTLLSPFLLLNSSTHKRTWRGPWDYDDEPETRAENL